MTTALLTSTMTAAIQGLHEADRLFAFARHPEPYDEFGCIVEGFGGVTKGTALCGVHVGLNLGTVRVIIDADDEKRFERTALDDGRIAFDFSPQTEEGICVSVATMCDITARELVDALRIASDELACDILLGATTGLPIEDGEVAGAA